MKYVFPAGVYKTTGAIDVRECGAVGDGVADDTAALQQAVNDAFHVRFTRSHAASVYILCPCGLQFAGSGEAGYLSAEVEAGQHMAMCGVVKAIRSAREKE